MSFLLTPFIVADVPNMSVRINDLRWNVLTIRAGKRDHRGLQIKKRTSLRASFPFFRQTSSELAGPKPSNSKSNFAYANDTSHLDAPLAVLTTACSQAVRQGQCVRMVK